MGRRRYTFSIIFAVILLSAGAANSNLIQNIFADNHDVGALLSQVAIYGPSIGGTNIDAETANHLYDDIASSVPDTVTYTPPSINCWWIF